MLSSVPVLQDLRAEHLNKSGHDVTVYERSDRVGGLFMYGIPNMKLEKTYIDRKVKIMKEEGVVFKTGVNVGKDIKAQDLKKQYDAISTLLWIIKSKRYQSTRKKEQRNLFCSRFLKINNKEPVRF